MNLLGILLNPELLAATLRMSTSIVLAALGGVLCFRAGIFNIAIDGFMLIGAFFSIAVIEWTHGNVWLGLLGGVLSGILISILYAFVVIRLKADQTIVGIAINIFSYGLTSFLLYSVFGSPGAYQPAVINKIPYVKIPLLQYIPYFGEAFAQLSPIEYLPFLLVIVAYILLFKTPFGLAVQSLGEEPQAVRTAGINTETIKYKVIIWSGAISGLAGAYLSSVVVSQFIDNMIQGRGFTAITAITFAGRHPVWTFFASYLFGFADAIGIRLEIIGKGIPPSIIKMFPYLLAVITLTVSSAIRLKKQANKLF